MSGAGGSVACFGEVLLRLSAPDRDRLLQRWSFDVCVGGAEANVATALARFGHAAKLVSVLSDNAMGTAALAELRRVGVDVSAVRRAPGRVGLYFLETGAGSRPSRILYDRQGSAFALADAGGYDWSVLLAGASWLHLSGVTPAIGPNVAAAAVAAARNAAAHGMSLAFDGNYRAQMWALWPSKPIEVLHDILACARLAFVNERDIGLVLGRAFEGPAARADAFAAAFDAFPRLEMLAATTRRQAAADDHVIFAELVTREGRWVSEDHHIAGVVDRIGAGDVFAAGVLHGLLTDMGPERTIAFAAAAAALKHTVRGDAFVGGLVDVEDLLAGGGLDVRR